MGLTLLLMACSMPVIRSPNLLRNPTFISQPADPEWPAEWRIDGEAVAVTLDRQHRAGAGPSVRVAYSEGASYAGVVQRVSVASLNGRSIRVEALLDRVGAGAEVGIWIGVFDNAKRRLGYENSYTTAQRPAGTWTPHLLTVDLPQAADFVLVGAAIHGKSGTLWLGRIDAYAVPAPAAR